MVENIRANGDVIQEIRQAMSLTQSRLAVEANCEIQDVVEAENNGRIQAVKLRRIAAALGLPYNSIVSTGW